MSMNDDELTCGSELVRDVKGYGGGMNGVGEGGGRMASGEGGWWAIKVSIFLIKSILVFLSL